MRRHTLARHTALAALAGVAALLPGAARAQGGAGAAGLQALQLAPGARAAGLSGAYTGAADADVMFYNPSGIGALRFGASLSYQRHVQEVSFGSAAVARRAGPVVLGLGIAYLDAGAVDVVEPDPAYGGERGRATGAVARASESAVRVAAALPVGERVRLGAVAGWASSSIAGVQRAAPFVDAGLQVAVSRVTLGAAVRNVGGSLAGDGASMELPREARVGAMATLPAPSGLGAQASADWVRDLVGREGWIVAGVEAGHRPSAGRRVGIVGRAGYHGGGDVQGALTLGGGVTVRGVAFDYAWQRLALFGPTHRLGVRIERD